MIAAVCGALDAALFGLLGALHVYWALGGQWGRDAALPTRGGTNGVPARAVLRPTPLTTLIVALLLFAAALAMLGRIGWLPVLPMGAYRFAAWALALLFLLRAVGEFRYVGFFKTVRGTRFARLDSVFFSPLCLLIAALAGIVAWLGP